MQGRLTVTSDRIRSYSLSVLTISTLQFSLHCIENAYRKDDWCGSLAILVWVLLCKFEKNRTSDGTRKAKDFQKIVLSYCDKSLFSSYYQTLINRAVKKGAIIRLS